MVQVRRLAARIRFTRLVDGEAGGGENGAQLDKAEKWLLAEGTALQQLLDSQLTTPMRKLALFMDVLRVELAAVLQLARDHLRDADVTATTSVTSGTVSPPLVALGRLRAYHDPSTERTFLSATLDGVERTANYGFFFESKDWMLANGSGALTAKVRQACLLECAAARQGLGFALGPAGTGKTESFADAASELGRPFLVSQGDTNWETTDGIDSKRLRLEEIMENVPGVFVCLDELVDGPERPASAVLPPLLNMLGRIQARSCGLLLTTCNPARLRLPEDKNKRKIKGSVKMTPAEAAVTNLSQPLELPLPIESGTVLDRVWTVLDRPPEPRIGGLGEFAVTASQQASFLEFVKPDMKKLADRFASAEGLQNNRNPDPRIGGVPEFFEGACAASEFDRAASARFLSERPFQGGMFAIGLRTFQGYFAHMGAGAPLQACRLVSRQSTLWVEALLTHHTMSRPLQL